MRIQFIIAVSAIALVGIVGVADASINAIDAFTGDMHEGFEAIGSLGSHPGPVEILEGGATFSDSLARSLMIANSLFSGISGESIYPYNGNLMGGSVTGWADIVFTTPVTKFGGYLGTADSLSGGTITFWDDSDTMLDELPLQLVMGDWKWLGWESDTPIGRVQIKGAASPGFGVTYDDLQISVVPEPASLGLLAMGSLVLFAGKRRASR